MISIRTRKIGRVLIIIVALQLCPQLTQAVPPEAQAPRSLQQFFQGLVEQYSPSKLPKDEDLMKVTEHIADGQPEEISRALPSIVVALAHHDDKIKLYAAVALGDIALRPDSGELLKKYLNAIGNLFNSSSDRLQGSAVLILGSLKPAPPPEVWPLLLTYLNRTDRDTHMQAAAIFYLVWHFPRKPEDLDVIERFLSRPLGAETRIGILTELAGSPLKDVRVIDMVIRSLDDPEQSVRLKAIQTLTHLGQHALLRAEPAMKRLAERSDEPAEVKDAARKALKEIGPGKD
ncbi:MAG: hypothetical protein LAO21_20790 [Acidobacteriia bacterium]|nr:hypothetical protein [Terriglobia bacterium]